MVRGWTGCLSCRSCAEAMRGRAGALRTAEMGLAETNGGSGLRALKEGSGGVVEEAGLGGGLEKNSERMP